MIIKNQSYLLICIFILVLFLLATSFCFSQEFNYQKAYQLYQQVVRGEKNLENMDPDERKQVIIIHRILSDSNDDKGSEECQGAKERARSAADELTYYAKKLKDCSESYDFSDDCYSEYRRTKNAFDEYEAAVSEVSSECD